MGGRSYKLATLFGIRVGVNASWFLILFLFILLLNEPVRESLAATEGTAYAVTVLLPLVFFGSIVLHELGHAMAARREGIGVSGIDLFFFGGLMRMNRDTSSPGSEFRVAIAGPVVTLLLALGFYAVSAAISSPETALNAGRFEGDDLGAVELVMSFAAWVNAALLVFNLIPAYPLDGGRVLRAAAWRISGDRERGTRMAARVGQGFAYLLIAGGIALAFTGDAFNGIWFVALGWLMSQAAGGAVAQTAFSEKLRGVTVADIMDVEPVVIPAGLRAREAWEDFYLRYGWDWFAITEGDGRLVGPAQRAAVEHAVEAEGGTMPMRELVSREAAHDGRVEADATLEALLTSQELRRLGALMAVDERGRLRGVVTLDQVTRALQSRLAPS